LTGREPWLRVSRSAALTKTERKPQCNIDWTVHTTIGRYKQQNQEEAEWQEVAEPKGLEMDPAEVELEVSFLQGRVPPSVKLSEEEKRMTYHGSPDGFVRPDSVKAKCAYQLITTEGRVEPLLVNIEMDPSSSDQAWMLGGLETLASQLKQLQTPYLWYMTHFKAALNKYDMLMVEPAAIEEVDAKGWVLSEMEKQVKHAWAAEVILRRRFEKQVFRPKFQTESDMRQMRDVFEINDYCTRCVLNEGCALEVELENTIGPIAIAPCLEVFQICACPVMTALNSPISFLLLLLIFGHSGLLLLFIKDL